MADDSTATDELSEELPPQGHVKVVYLGPVAPHWEVHDVMGDRALIDAFRQRVTARLQLLPPHDPQFHRNRARVDRDAERERLVIEWDLGFDEPTASPAAPTASPAASTSVEASAGIATEEAAPTPAEPSPTQPTADASAEAEPETTEAEPETTEAEADTTEAPDS